MSTVIRTHESATRSDSFTAMTAGGRTMHIEVTASEDIAEATILEDLRESLHKGANVKVAKEINSRWEDLAAIFIYWLLFCAFSMCTVFVMDIAEFVTVSSSFRFAENLPLIGGFAFWTGMIRIYLILLPTIITLWAVRILVIKTYNKKS